MEMKKFLGILILIFIFSANLFAGDINVRKPIKLPKDRDIERPECFERIKYHSK